jgi:hypothetical protein
VAAVFRQVDPRSVSEGASIPMAAHLRRPRVIGSSWPLDGCALRRCDNGMECGDVAFKRAAPKVGQCHPNSSTVIGHRPFHNDVPRLFKGGQLFGERRIRHCQSVAQKGELCPVGRGQEGDDRQASAGMDELIESSLDRRHVRSARRVVART